MKLWLVRHAQPLIKPGLCYGQLDVAADAIATQRAAQAISPLLPASATLYCSGLLRARQLAKAIHDQRKTLLPKIDVRLNEMNFGIWEGIAWDDIPKTAFDTWTADFDQHRFGGVEGVRDLLLRVHQALHALPAVGDAIWITHAGVIRAVNYLERYGLETIATPENWPNEAPAFGLWQCLEFGQLETR
jgi:alpha-ribazole phosphatase